LLLLARKNLFSERTRLAISVGGVALAVFLISLLLSLYRGWDEKVGGFVENSPIDVWIGSQGTQSFLTAASILPTEGDDGEGARDFLNDNPSVERWDYLIVRPLEGIKVKLPRDDYEPDAGTKMDLQLIGYNPLSGMGGPLKIVEGKATPGPGEVIVDEALRDRYGVKAGDIVSAGGLDWTVVGVSSGGDFVAVQTVFTTLDAAREALSMQGLTTFYVIDMKPKADEVDFASDLEILFPAIAALPRGEFAQATRDRILGEILPILVAVLGLAFIVGLAIAGLTIYTATVEKSREYGILKAVGFKNRYLYRVVLEQSLVTGTLGFAIGAGLTLAISPFARDFVPQFVTFVKWQDILLVAGATLVMSGIAAYIPVRRLASIDPVAVFKA
jgi:putative ABC transport system permease protein